MLFETFTSYHVVLSFKFIIHHLQIDMFIIIFIHMNFTFNQFKKIQGQTDIQDQISEESHMLCFTCFSRYYFRVIFFFLRDSFIFHNLFIYTG